MVIRRAKLEAINEAWKIGARRKGRLKAVKMLANTLAPRYTNIRCTDGKVLTKQEGVKPIQHAQRGRL